MKIQQEVSSFLIVTQWMQLNVISSSEHQHMVVSALTHGYYLTWLFIVCAGLVSHLFNIFIPQTISSFSLSFVHIYLMSYFLLLFLFHSFICQSYHYSSPLSFLLLLYIRIASLHLIFLSFIPFVLSHPFLLSTVF
jgi:hypothetical protein